MSTLPILGYKRHPRPVLENSAGAKRAASQEDYKMGIYLDDELQRLENSFDQNAQQTQVTEDGVTEVKQTIIDINNTVGNNTSAITQEAITRTGENSAFASLITTVQANVATNSASVITEATARADAISAEATARQLVQANVDTVSASVDTEATARADAISAEAILRQAVQANVDTVSAAVIYEASVSASANSATASAVTTLTADLGTANGNIANNYNISVTADNVLTQSINSLTSTVGQNTSDITTTATTAANANGATASLVTALTATVATANANIANNYNISVNEDTALANSISTVSAAVGTVATSVTTETNARIYADGVLETKYGVTLNANGYITGFSQNNNGSTGAFKILADKFTIIDPAAAGSGLQGTQVFDITNGVVTMEAAHINNLTVGNVGGTISATTVFSGSASKTFGGTSAGYVELTTVDCPANSGAKAHVPVLNMIFDGAFATDTAYVKLEYATLTNGSPSGYTAIQTLRHKTAAGGNSWTTIPVIGSAPSTTSAVRFKVSIQMYADNGTSSTNQSRTGTAHWSGTTVGIV